MRTTVNIDDRLFAAAKQQALSRHATLGAIIEEALRLALQRPADVAVEESFELVTFKGDSPRPGVNLDKPYACSGSGATGVSKGFVIRSPLK